MREKNLIQIKNNQRTPIFAYTNLCLYHLPNFDEDKVPKDLKMVFSFFFHDSKSRLGNISFSSRNGETIFPIRNKLRNKFNQRKNSERGSNCIMGRKMLPTFIIRITTYFWRPGTWKLKLFEKICSDPSSTFRPFFLSKNAIFNASLTFWIDTKEPNHSSWFYESQFFEGILSNRPYRWYS